MNKIQVGYLVSYDYELLKNAIPRVYVEADTIYLAIDSNRLTWNGEKYFIEESFFEWINTIDRLKKIVWYEDNFYVEGYTTMQCEVRQRKMLSDKMGIGNWLIQLDADEYFLDFKSFVNDLKKYNYYLSSPSKNPIQFSTFLINLYKQVEDGFLYIDEPTKCMTATNYPDYKVGRNIRKRIIYTRHLMFHETLSRNVEELEIKFKNWGHNSEVNTNFLAKWKSATKENYTTLTNLFYLQPQVWKKLAYVQGLSISECMNNFDTKSFAPSSFFLCKKNIGQWFKFLLKKY
jgi:hypothetical protein